MPKPRRSVRFEAWPDIDQALWREAVRDDDLLADVGVAARWAPRTRDTVLKGYGDWLFWLDGQNLLDPAIVPEDRCSPANLLTYVQSLQARVSPGTVAHRVIALERALCALAPHSDRSHLRRLINNLPKQGVTSRKRARLQEPADLVELGMKLMRGAEQSVHNDARKNACVYRDGLQIALLAMRPLRRKNFVEMALHRHLVRIGEGWRIRFAPFETKTWQPIDVPFPTELVPYLERYLSKYRLLLMAERCRGDRLWISYRFAPQAPHTLGINTPGAPSALSVGQ